MTNSTRPLAAASAQTSNATNYPPEYAGPMSKRHKAKLGDLFGLQNFGVNMTTMEPGGVSALKHTHARQDEFIFIVSGSVTLHVGDEDYAMTAGDCVGFPAGGAAHQLENQGTEPVVFLEVGDRTEGDRVEYADVDMIAKMVAPGRWQFIHKNGEPYD